MTLAEARRLLGVKTNYQFAKKTGWQQSTISRWKDKNGRVPPAWADRIRKGEFS
jgi:hypothetical protein